MISKIKSGLEAITSLTGNKDGVFSRLEEIDGDYHDPVLFCRKIENILADKTANETERFICSLSLYPFLDAVSKEYKLVPNITKEQAEELKEISVNLKNQCEKIKESAEDPSLISMIESYVGPKLSVEISEYIRELQLNGSAT